VLTMSDHALIDSIVKWIRNSNIQYSSPEIIAQQLEDGSWLDWFNGKIGLSSKKSPQDAV
jgi:hypothetical protein